MESTSSRLVYSWDGCMKIGIVKNLLIIMLLLLFMNSCGTYTIPIDGMY